MADPTVFAWETVSSGLASGLEDLVALDWEEATVGRDPCPVLDIDWREYLRAERAGQYKAVSARKDGKLIGYNGYDIFKPKRHKSALWAFGDAMFIDKAHRKGLLAVQFLKESHALLKALGVQWVCKGDMVVENLDTAKPRASFGDLLVKMGYSPYDRSYVLKL